MKCLSSGNYGGLKQYTSAKTGKTYTSLVIIDEENESIDIGVPESEVLKISMALANVKRFDVVEVSFKLSIGAYTKLMLDELSIPQKIDINPLDFILDDTAKG